MKGKSIGYNLVLLVLLVTSLEVQGQKERIRFNHYTSDNGLSQNRVDCILRDKRGFMWFATWNGLNRFDGYNFSTYKSSTSDTTSLSDNYINWMSEDRSHNIWVATESGLCQFLFDENRFVRYSYKKEFKGLSSNKIRTVYVDRQGIVWVGTRDRGIDRLEFGRKDKNGVYIRSYRNIPRRSNSLSSNSVSCFLQDRNNNFWVGTDNGVNKLNSLTGVCEHFFNTAEPQSISLNTINCIFQDSRNNIWIGTVFGLNRLNPDGKTFTRFFSSGHSNSLPHNTITSISEDNAGNLLIGTLGGLSLYNYQENNFTNYTHNLNDPFGLNNDFIASVYADKFDNVWIGTDKGGVNHYNINQKKFMYIEHEQGDPNTISSNTINSVFDTGDILWIGTAGGGLNKLDKKTGKMQHFMTSNNPSSISSNFITSFALDEEGSLWIGTWGGGLNKLSRALSGNISFVHYVASSHAGDLVNSFVSSLIEDRQGNIWVGTLGGLDRYDRAKNVFEHFSNIAGSSSSITEVGCLLFDRQGFLWAGTQRGLFRVMPGTDGQINLNNASRIDHIVNNPDRPSSLSGNYVISIIQDSRENIWIGTYGHGLNFLPHNQVNGSVSNFAFTRYGEENGLCNNVVYAIQEDKNNNLWLSTDNGLSRLSIDNKQFKKYTIADGLESNQFYWNSSCKASDGKLYFGSMNGLTVFYPEKIKEDCYKPSIAITDLKVFNQSVNVESLVNGRVLLHKSISTSDHINLSYKDNVFSIEFAALHYAQPEKSQYAYMLEGFDQDWVYVSSDRRFATYTNIRGGDYTFKVKATNNDGIWNEGSYKLHIHISPPFYTTWWFRLIMLVLIVVAVFLWFKYRTRQLEYKKKRLEIQVKERTIKIEEQKEELKTQAEHLIETNRQLEVRQNLIEGQKEQLEQQNQEILHQRDKLIEMNKKVQQANQQKMQFYTNVSHELRTPLTLILGPAEEMLSNWKGDAPTQKRLTLIYNNAQRLLHLINQLMDFRKVETGKMELKLMKGDLVAFSSNICQSFSELADKRDIEFSFEAYPLKIEMPFDHEKVENILFNLISNAFKYTPHKGKIGITIRLFNDDISQEGKKSKLDNWVEIKVSDTGIGISEENLPDIFKRFHRVHTRDSVNVKGSGIGLSLAKEMVKIHQGNIFVESKRHEGSVFCVKLPLNYDSVKAEILDNEDTEAWKSNLDPLVSLLSNQMSEKKSEAKSEIPADALIKPLILIVEDNPEMRAFIVDNLDNKYRILEASDGQIGLELAQMHAPALIISDVMMPIMDGIELCKKLKTDFQTSHIPVIMLTARNSEENMVEGLEAGADDYIPKPFNKTVLEARIQNLIDSRKKLRRTLNDKLATRPNEITTNPADEQFLQRAIRCIEENIRNPDYGVQELIIDLKISRSLLHKKLTAIVGQSATDFITSIRLKRAAYLLSEGLSNISEVAYQVGFNDPKYFSRCFRKQFNKTPSEYAGNKE
jgi:signal transduction histidine kinase/ligand-binding sensor domain-containing protein/DNA-binding response OmpR family regulator